MLEVFGIVWEFFSYSKTIQSSCCWIKFATSWWEGSSSKATIVQGNWGDGTNYTNNKWVEKEETCWTQYFVQMQGTACKIVSKYVTIKTVLKINRYVNKSWVMAELSKISISLLCKTGNTEMHIFIASYIRIR